MKPSFKNPFTQLVAQAPLETLTCTLFTVLTVVLHHFETKGYENLPHIEAYFPLFFASCFIPNLLFGKQQRLLYWLVGITGVSLLSILSIYLSFSPGPTWFLMSYAAAGGGIFLCLRDTQSEEMLSARIITFLVDASLAMFTALIIYFIDMFIAYTAETLYHNNSWFVYSYQWNLYFITPLMLVVLHFKHNGDALSNTAATFLRTIAHYVISPAIVLYTLFLYLYAGSSFVGMKLPEGGVATLIVSLYAATLLGYTMHLCAPSRFFNWFYKWFGVISIPLLVLFWWGISHRVMEYSLTENRIYILAMGTLFTVASLLLSLKRGNHLRLILGGATAIIALFTFIPGITARYIGINAQTARLEKSMDALGTRDLDGNFTPFSRQYLDKHNKEIEQMQAAYSYLCNVLGYSQVNEEYKSLKESGILDINTTNGLDEFPVFFISLDRDQPVNTTTLAYPYFYGSTNSSNQDFNVDTDSDVITATLNDKVILQECIHVDAISKALQDHHGIGHIKTNDVETFIYRNDSVCIVLDRYDVITSDTALNGYSGLNGHSGNLFAKKPL